MKILTLSLFLISNFCVSAQSYLSIRGGVFLAKHDYGVIGGGLSDEIPGFETGIMTRLIFKGIYFQP